MGLMIKLYIFCAKYNFSNMRFIKIWVLSLLVLGCGFDVDDPVLDPPANLTYNPNNVIINVSENFASVPPIIDGVPPFLFKLDNAVDLGSFILFIKRHYTC